VPANIINDEQKLQTYLTQNPHIAYPKLDTPTKVSRAMAIEAFKKPVE
jgi:deoxyribodipyrimidine photo-lyase